MAKVTIPAASRTINMEIIKILIDKRHDGGIKFICWWMGNIHMENVNRIET